MDENYRSHFDNWLKNGYNAKMQWIERNIDIRFNPKLLLENAETAVVVLLKNTTPSALQPPIRETKGNFAESKIARYACGEDYHKNIRRKLKLLSEKIKELLPDINTRICVDSAPILEKYWAMKAGLGFIGRNTLFISPKIGSFCNIGILLLDLDICVENKQINVCEGVKGGDRQAPCENCNKCINSCPPKALVAPFTLDCNKCISYQNQYKSEPDFDYLGWEKGCDICQEVCPFNKRGLPVGVAP